MEVLVCPLTKVRACSRPCIRMGNQIHVSPTDPSTHSFGRTPQQEPLVYDAEHHALLSQSIGVRYPISKETGIPNLVPREATLVQEEGEAK